MNDVPLTASNNARSSQQRPQSSHVEAFAVALTELAGLFHDLGKASVAFQTKLKRGAGAEVLRHDLLSFLILAESLVHDEVCEISWLRELATTPSSAAACTTAQALLPANSPWLTKIQQRLNSDRGVLLSRADLALLDRKAPGLLTVLWLVLTHHRLPAGDDLAEQLDAGLHLNKPHPDQDFNLAPLEECLQPHGGDVPWNDSSWQAAVAAAAQAALAAHVDLHSAGPIAFPDYFWPQLSAHLLRPSLILSDHIGSMQAEKGDVIEKAFAGSTAYANRHGAHHAGDTLPRHLTRVAKLCRQTTSIALACADLPLTELPASSPALKTGLPAAYAWQEQLGDACASARKHGPVFASIIAETGAGKTLAGVRALHQLSGGPMRFTLALGLRSLTWQSATSMLEDAQLSAKDLTVAVGQPQTLGLDVKAAENQRGSARLGSESVAGSAPDAALNNKDFDANWLRGICTEAEAVEYWGASSLALLSAPVLACTVDHLVAAVSLLRGGDAKLFLRQTSADLLLDEIDAYSAQDLQSLGKLTFVAGLHGRNVVMMSATMSPAVQQGLFGAWLRGMTLRASLKCEPLAYGTVFAANTDAPQVLERPSVEAANTAWLGFVKKVCIAYAANALMGPRRRLAVHALQADTREEAFAEIETCAVELHSAHATVDPQTGKRVSIGFVRFNTAKTAWQFADYLATTPGAAAGPDVRFVAYHSKFPRNYLGVLDATLKQACTRKDPLEFLNTPALRQALDSSVSDDVVVIVCTTTLIETGRDFDFDWAILEPRSVRGEVQAAGRVRRHRKAPLASDAANILLLSTPLRLLENPDGPAWSRPGIEDALPKLRVTESVPLALQKLGMAAASVPAKRKPGAPALRALLNAAEVLPVEQWQHVFDAQLCLSAATHYESNRIGYLEQAVQAVNLTAPWNPGSAVAPSLHWYLNSWGPLNAHHAQATPFRGETTQSAIFVPRAGKVEAYDEASHSYVTCLEAEMSNVPSGRALIADLPDQAALLTSNDKHIIGASLRVPNDLGISFKAMTWDPLLGFFE